MTEKLLTCDEFDAMLSELLEGTLDEATRDIAERHARSCARCEALLSDLTTITRDARTLPDLAPSRDLWAGIEARIQAPVVPLSAARPAVPRFRPRTAAWLGAAAAALIAVTASITYVATKHTLGPQNQVATTTRPGPATTSPATTPAGSAAQPAPPSATPAPAPVTTLHMAKAVPVTQLYDQQIAQLAAIVRDRRSQLDTATVAVIERNLRIINRAIAQSRAALAKDPGSRFLNDQLNSVLNQKLELLRTVALLPART